MKPLIRVFHVSDMHFAPQDNRAARFRRVVRATFGKFNKELAKRTLQGVSPHDNTAVRELEDSIVAAAHDGLNCPTHLVCTGDLTTWGDNDSVQQAWDALQRIADSAGLGTPTVLYGNHDVWPADPWSLRGFPLFSSQKELDKLRSDFRHKWFRNTWPLSLANDQTFFEAQGTGTERLTFCSLNTVLHHRLYNMLALGEIACDRYWEVHHRNPTDQCDALLQHHVAPGDIGVALTHHPIHVPTTPRRGLLSMFPRLPMRVLRNATTVANTLAGPNNRHAVHVFLSGHVHQVIPAVGSLTLGGQSPLADSQLQLCVGTATQQSPPSVRVRQYWQELRFYLEPDTLTIERVVYLRQSQIGGFTPVSAKNDPQGIAEHVTLPLC